MGWIVPWGGQSACRWTTFCSILRTPLQAILGVQAQWNPLVHPKRKTRWPESIITGHKLNRYPNWVWKKKHENNKCSNTTQYSLHGPSMLFRKLDTFILFTIFDLQVNNDLVSDPNRALWKGIAAFSTLNGHGYLTDFNLSSKQNRLGTNYFKFQ